MYIVYEPRHPASLSEGPVARYARCLEIEVHEKHTLTVLCEQRRNV
jgi:hypothetical protein